MFELNNEILIALVGLFSTLLTSIISYKKGRRTQENEANKAAFEAYSYAIESLRKEFEARINLLQKENKELREEIKRLEELKFKE